jgi:hypothetical protein
MDIVHETPKKNWSELFYSAMKCDQLHVVEYLLTVSDEFNLVNGVPRRHWNDLFLSALRSTRPEIVHALYSLGFEEPREYPDMVKELVDEFSHQTWNVKLGQCIRVILDHKQASPVKSQTFRHWKVRFRNLEPHHHEHPQGVMIPFPRK